MKTQEDIEADVQKTLTNFCKYLNVHVDKWKGVLDESTRIIQSLCNQAEQLRHVEKVNLHDMRGFEETKNSLKCSILNGIEEEIASIKIIIEKLSSANQELNNKLTVFEKSTLELDWDKDSVLMNGGPTQPPLMRLLEDSLEFWLYFKTSFEKLNGKFKEMDLKCAKSMANLEKAFQVNLNEKVLVDLIALTQYVDNEISIV